MKPIDIPLTVRVKPVNKPTDQVILRIGTTEIRKPACDLARELLAPILADNGLVAAAEPQTIVHASAIGAELEGGIYAGLTLVDNRPAQLIVHKWGDTKMAWQKGIDWAAKQGGVLPSRFDGLVLLTNLKDRFKSDWYWTAEQPADDSSCAWFQSFINGLQSYYLKGLECHVCAVSRVLLP